MRSRTISCLAILLAGCAQPFTNYQGSLPDEQVATLQSCILCVRRIWKEEDKTLVYDPERDRGRGRAFRLTPGRYIVYYVADAYNIPRVVRTDTVEFKAGHAYQIENDHCYATSLGGACMTHRPYTQTIWLEDLTTGEVLAGDKWKWDRYTGDDPSPR